LFISAFAAGTRERLRIIADYASHIDASLLAEEDVRRAAFADMRAEIVDDETSSPDFDASFSADGAIHRIVWNSYVVALVSLLEERLREAWIGLVRHKVVSGSVEKRLSVLMEKLQNAVPGVHDTKDALALDVQALLRIRNQIVHADADGDTLGERARELLLLNHALNTAGEDEVQGNAAFAAFARELITNYLERLIRLLPDEAQKWPTF